MAEIERHQAVMDELIEKINKAESNERQELGAGAHAAVDEIDQKLASS